MESKPRIWRLLARLSGSSEQADDLSQEVAVKAYNSFEGFQGRSDIYSWLYRIAVNIFHRSTERKSHPTISLDDPDVIFAKSSETSPEAFTLSEDLRDRVWASLNRLPDEYRTTLILQVYEGMKYCEIANLLDIPLGTVKSRLNAAVSRLQEELNDDVM